MSRVDTINGWVDLATGRGVRGGQQVRLTEREREVVQYLVARSGQVVSRDELHREVWRHGSQVVSRAADFTVHRLRRKLEQDPSDPRHVLTAHGEGFRWAPLDRGPSEGLPLVELFIGRLDELDGLATAAAEPGLVTLLGPAGVGKTILAAELFRRYRTKFEHAVYIDLSATEDESDVDRALMVGLRIQPDNLPQALGAHGAMLLVLDNVEQVARPVAERVDVWLGHAPGLTVVVTSQQPLEVSGERRIRVPPMSRADAVALFVAHGGLAASHADVGVLDAIVERLDRMPLALQLAAPRAAVLGAATLLERLDDPFRVLRLPARSTAAVSGRHTSVEREVARSWALLEAHEQQALAQLSVFSGGFTSSRAERVVELPPGVWLPDVLAALVERGLLRSWVPEGLPQQVRLAPYGVVQRFAAAALTNPGPAQIRHGATFAADIDDAWLENLHRDLRRCVAEARADEANLKAAARRALLAERNDMAARLCVALAVVHRFDPWLVPTIQALWERRNTLGPWEAVAVAKLQGDHTLYRGGTCDVETTLALARASSSEVWLWKCADQAAVSHKRCGRFDAAIALYEEIIAGARARSSAHAEAWLLVQLAHLHVERRDTTTARPLLSLALHRARTVDDGPRQRHVLRVMALCEALDGQFSAAYAALEQLERVPHRSDWNEGHEQSAIGVVYTLAHDVPRAEGCFRESLASARRSGTRRDEFSALHNLGFLAMRQGRHGEAEPMLRDAAEGFSSLFDVGAEASALVLVAECCAARGARSESQALLARSEPLFVRPQHRIEWLTAHGFIALLEGELTIAADWLRRIDALAENLGLGPQSESMHDPSRLRQALSSAHRGS